jgi:putative ABC transport system permease protein
VLAITVADLRFRARQFVIAIVGASLVFAMTLLLTGLSAGFRNEITQTVQGFGATSWVVARGTAGRVGSLAPIPETYVSSVARSPGAGRATPVVIVPQPATRGRSDTGSINSSDIVLIGQTTRAMRRESLASGHWPSAPWEAVTDTDFNVSIGHYFSASGHVFLVVGRIEGRTLLGGQPDVYVTLADAQAVVFGGRPLISAVLTSGVPTRLPRGVTAYSNTRIELSSLNEMSAAVSSVDGARSFMWVIAAIILASLVYVGALQRTRDFAIMKALGSSTQLLFLGLAGQAVAVSVLAACLGAIISNFMGGLFALNVAIPRSAFATLPLAAIVVGLVASLAALRRAVSIDPALAFIQS